MERLTSANEESSGQGLILLLTIISLPTIYLLSRCLFRRKKLTYSYPSNMRIILISGYRGTGKDHLSMYPRMWNLCHLETKETIPADHVIPDRNCRRLKLADPLKAIGAILLNQFEENYEEWKENHHPILGGLSGRNLLVKVAATLRKINPTFFVDHLIDRIQEARMGTGSVITDWRYPNELDRLKEEFPDAEIVTIRVYRRHHSNGKIINLPTKDDLSERSLDHEERIDYFAIPEYQNIAEALRDYTEEFYLS